MCVTDHSFSTSNRPVAHFYLREYKYVSCNTWNLFLYFLNSKLNFCIHFWCLHSHRTPVSNNVIVKEGFCCLEKAHELCKYADDSKLLWEWLVLKKCSRVMFDVHIQSCHSRLINSLIWWVHDLLDMTYNCLQDNMLHKATH